MRRILEVYSWASMLTAESRADIEHYYWAETARRLLIRLGLIIKGLVGVVGLQGTGKSTLLFVLCSSLKAEAQNGELNTVMFKWSSNWINDLFASHSAFLTGYREDLQFECSVLKGDEAASSSLSLPRRKLIALHGDTDDIATMEKIVGEARTAKIKRDSVSSTLRELRYIFIDMPDYSKTNRKLMDRDLDQLQNFWGEVSTNSKCTLVIAMQKELFKGHFFFGKMDVTEITPLKPQELVEAYKQQFQTTEPFSEEALLSVAHLSRGVFRRFLKYVKLAIEPNLEKAMSGELIAIEERTVRDSIGLEVLTQDMDLELSDVFKSGEQKVQAVKILSLLRERSGINQKEIAETLGLSEAMATRIITKLESYNYLLRQRGSKSTFNICLKE